MQETLICVADDGPSAAATTAFGLWLGDSLGARPLVFGGRRADDVIAVAARYSARGVVIAGGGGESFTRRVAELIRCLPGELVVLPPESQELWRDPHAARSRAGPAIVVGADGSPASVNAAEAAGRIAAGLGVGVVVAHARRQRPLGLPARSSTLESDPIASADRESRQELLASAVEAAQAHGATADVRLLDGDAVTALDDLAAGGYSPLIAIGASRANGEQTALRSSVAIELIARQDQPVLIARPEARGAIAQPQDGLRMPEAIELRGSGVPEPAVRPLTCA